MPLLVASVLAGCAKPEPPTVRPQAARVTMVGPAGVEMQVELNVRNPNAFPLVVRSVEGTFKLGNGQELGRGQATPDAPIPAKGELLVKSTLSIPWSNLGALLPLVASEQPVPYQFAGTAQIGGERLNVSLPYSLNGELTRTQLTEIGLRALSR